MTDSIVTETRTEVTTKEVTETRYRCHVCELLYDGEEVIRIGLDRQPAGGGDMFGDSLHPRAERTVCGHCADGLFDYDADSGGAFDESETRYDRDWLTVAAARATVLVFVAAMTVLAAVGVALAGGQVPLVIVAGAAVVIGFGVGWRL